MTNLIPRLAANLPLILLLVGMVIGGIWIHRVWHQAHGADDESTNPHDLLAQFREAHEAGEIDDAEFRRIRQALMDPTLPFPNLSATRDRPAPRATEPAEPAPPAAEATHEPPRPVPPSDEPISPPESGASQS